MDAIAVLQKSIGIFHIAWSSKNALWYLDLSNHLNKDEAHRPAKAYLRWKRPFTGAWNTYCELSARNIPLNHGHRLHLHTHTHIKTLSHTHKMAKTCSTQRHSIDVRFFSCVKLMASYTQILWLCNGNEGISKRPSSLCEHYSAHITHTSHRFCSDFFSFSTRNMAFAHKHHRYAPIIIVMSNLPKWL